MQKQHIFVNPFYYIDYALAQICAFQFFERSKKSRKRRGTIITVSARQAEARDILHCWSWPD